MSKYYFTYRLETSIEADSLQEAREAFDAMELQDLTNSPSTMWKELDSVTDENDMDLMLEYDALY